MPLMVHPLLRLLATRPQLLADHAQAYAELVTTEVDLVSSNWKRRALLSAVALFCLAAAAVLAGVALMLWAVVPASSIHEPWVLIATPLAPIALALGCLVAMRQRSDVETFDKLRQQLKADWAMLRELAIS